MTKLETTYDARGGRNSLGVCTREWQSWSDLFVERVVYSSAEREQRPDFRQHRTLEVAGIYFSLYQHGVSMYPSYCINRLFVPMAFTGEQGLSDAALSWCVVHCIWPVAGRSSRQCCKLGLCIIFEHRNVVKGCPLLVTMVTIVWELMWLRRELVRAKGRLVWPGI